MSAQGSFGRGYTVHRDGPKTNGGSSQQDREGTTDQASKANGSTDGHNHYAHGHSWDDPNWSILDDRRGDLPEFPIDTLSVPCQKWIERAAHGAGVTPAHVAVPLLGIVSSLIGTSRRVMASRSWTQAMTSWTAVVGFSGTGKTPGIDATKRALSQIERSRRDKIAELKRAHEGRVETAKAARAQWKKDLKRAAEGKIVRLGEYRTERLAQPSNDRSRGAATRSSRGSPSGQCQSVGDRLLAPSPSGSNNSARASH
jgi:hypothetical protein